MRLLYVGDPALVQECLGRRGGSIDVLTATAGPGGTWAPFIDNTQTGVTPPVDVVLIEHGHAGIDALAMLRDLAARKVYAPAVVVADWDEDLAAAALTLGASDYVVKSRPSFRALYFRLHRLIAHFPVDDELAGSQPKIAGTIDVDREKLAERAKNAEDARNRAEAQLNEALASMKQARQGRLADAVAAAREHAQREHHFAERLRAAAAASARLEQKLTDQETALRESERRRLGATAAAAHLGQREAALLAQLRDATAARQDLERRLVNTETALRCAEQRVLAESAASRQRAAEQQAEFEAERSQQAAGREMLRQQIGELTVALDQVRTGAAASAEAAAGRLADEEVRHRARLAEAVAAHEQLQRRLASSEAAHRAAIEQHAFEMADAAARLAESQELATMLADQAGIAIRGAEMKLAEAEEERRRADARHAGEMAEAADRLIRQQTESEIWLAEAAAFANALELDIADLSGALARVEQQAAVERETAAVREAQQRAAFEQQITDSLAERQALAAHLQALDASLADARAQHESALSEAAARFSEAKAKADLRLAQAEGAIRVAESKRAETAAAMERVVKQAAAERRAASEESRHAQALYRASMTDELVRRQLVEQELTATRQASAQSQQRFADEVKALADRSEEEARRAQQSLVRAEEEIERLERGRACDREEFEHSRASMEGELARVREDCSTLQRSLEETRATGRDLLARAAEERAAEALGLQSIIHERDAALDEQAARARAAEEAAAAALAAAEHRLQLVLEDRRRDATAIAALQARLEAAAAAIEASQRERDSLTAALERVPILEGELRALRSDERRQFNDIPVNRGRCTPNGTITDVNPRLAKLLGYETPEALRNVGFADHVFEIADDLRWLASRLTAPRTAQSIDTTWRRRNGSRLLVRVTAVPIDDDAIDLVVEDLTPLRTVEERLRNAQRMESVARYGSEVAVTCHALLTHVRDEGRQWLTRIESDTVRYQGELLMDEVARAAGFLGPFVAYGDEQSNAPDVVEVTQVLRDLEPVLKRVAGDDIEVVLPTTVSPLALDVEARPVERMLINLAAYGRERMKRGGRMMIDVDSVVLDREFASKYPNVRPGAHVRLTVNEVRTVAHADAAAPGDGHERTDNPGIDLGTLQMLVSNCGGHLWMKAGPPGDMTLKIHLPRRVLDRSEPAPRPRAVPSGRPRWIHRALGVRH